MQFEFITYISKSVAFLKLAMLRFPYLSWVFDMCKFCFQCRKNRNSRGAVNVCDDEGNHYISVNPKYLSFSKY